VSLQINVTYKIAHFLLFVLK